MSNLILKRTGKQNQYLKNMEQEDNSLTNVRLILKLKNHKFQISRSLLSSSQYLKRCLSTKLQEQQNQGNEKSIIIIFDDKTLNNMNVRCFQKLCKYYQGSIIEISRIQQIMMFIQIINQLKIMQLISVIKEDIIANREDYEFFTLLTISEKLQIQKIRDRCIRKLKSLNFEQLNYNRYDLLQCQQNIFKKILKIHQSFVKSHLCCGQSQSTIVQIIQSYCEANQKKIDPSQYSTSCLLDIIGQLDQQENQMNNQEYETSSYSSQGVQISIQSINDLILVSLDM